MAVAAAASWLTLAVVVAAVPAAPCHPSELRLAAALLEGVGIQVV